MVKFLKDIGNDDFTFEKDAIYEHMDGDEMDVKQLKGCVLIRQPNSPKNHDYWCQMDKTEIGITIEVVD